MPKHLTQYLRDKDSTISKMKHRPIILKWLTSQGMTSELELIDKHVAYLLPQTGGPSKLYQWFLSDDRNFNDIMVERYIIWYLRRQNPNIHDNLNSSGIDAYLDTPTGCIGVEVTSLTAFVAEWIFMERLAEFCWQDERLSGQGFEISCSYKFLQVCTQGNTIYDYIEQLGHAIATRDEEDLTALHVSVEYYENLPGYFSWRITDAETYSWYDPLTSGLTQKLQKKQKVLELSKLERNLIFVGVNHTSPNNWAVPRLFGYLKPSEDYNPYKSTVEALECYWTTTLPTLRNVIGICYFVCDLRQEEPFYPLRIFWRSDADQTDLAL